MSTQTTNQSGGTADGRTHETATEDGTPAVGTDPGRSDLSARSDLGPIRPVPFARLVRVETRKQYNTLAGRLFLLGIAAIVAVVILIQLLTGDGQVSWMGYLNGTITPLQILLPVVAIMAATSEWAQRTAMTTFTLEPRRGRTVGAKVISSLWIGAVLFALALGLAALGHLLSIGARGATADWTWSGWTVAGSAIVLATVQLQGSAFGLALLNTPAAIVAYFALPTALTLIGQFVESSRDALSWVDINSTTIPFFMGTAPSTEEWQKFAVSVGLWIVLPLAIGTWRVLKREVK